MPRLNLRTQLALLLSILSLALVAGTLVAVSVSFDQGFHSYLNASAKREHEALADTLASAMAKDPSLWERFLRHPHAFERWLYHRDSPRQSGPGPRDFARHRDFAQHERPPPDPGGFHRGYPPPRRDFPSPPPRPRDSPSFWLLDANKRLLAGPPLPPDEKVSTLRIAPLQPAGNTMGYLAWRPVRAIDNEADQIFARQQHRLFALIATIAVCLSVCVAWPLSRYLVNPIRQLAQAMRALIGRRFDTRVMIGSGNELGDLGRDFNRMADALQAHDAEQRQWLADISHELRTPLGVLKGEIEALQDGILPLTPMSIASLSDEVAQLSRLVDDLHQLAVTQSAHLRYHFHPIDLNRLLERLSHRLDGMMQRAGLHWQLHTALTPATLLADEQRLEQLIINLAQNSTRYTDSGGEVRASVQVGPGITLIWEDSAPGVDAADLEHLFNRFYRVEKSRQRAQGGSGLGLAIVANIVHAHAATIEAAPSPLGGLRILIRFKQGD